MQQTITKDRSTAQRRIPNGNPQAKVATLKYQQEQVRNLTPVQVVRKLYDVAIVACKKQEPELAQRAISELVCGLNFDYPEISVGLFRLYQYAKTSIRNGNMTEALRVLEELRGAWNQAFDLKNQ